MLELYFILYRVPKMMTRLARERGRSAVAWSLLGMGVWIGTEIIIFFAVGVLYGLGAAVFNWPLPIPAGVKFVVYVLALVAALLGVTGLSRILSHSPKQEAFIPPPPPPNFHSESKRGS